MAQYIETCLKALVDQKGTDLHLKPAHVPVIRIGKVLVTQEKITPATSEEFQSLIAELLDASQKRRLSENLSIDFSIDAADLGRFRGNFFYQQGQPVLVVRHIRQAPADFDELGLPLSLRDVVQLKDGLILVSGAVGSGKSTTIATMVQEINRTRAVSILTLEDPIEFIYQEDKAWISQREIGQDTKSFLDAMRYVVRQDADVVVIGEIRDADTLLAAMQAAKTGKLLISSIHSRSCMQTFERILGFFPHDQSDSVLKEISYCVKAIISQRLIPSLDQTLVPACEILRVNPTGASLIQKRELDKLDSLIRGRADGMQTMNQSLLKLVETGKISREAALAASDQPEVLEMNIRGIYLDDSSGRIVGN